MTINENTTDRMIRIALGATLLSLMVVGPRTLWGLLGLIPLVTGLTGRCPVYRMLGVDTCRFERRAW
ncbi:MAG TPA: DUF2892 domain-containing protein [Kofleriaceae bacterium]|nr:DUF2892 domain-containing protein [Kofleriaceae bacterium]